MYRTHTCGELRIDDINQKVTLSGWVQRTRDLGGMTFLDLRDRYGITQVVFNMETNKELCEQARKLGREFVVQVTGQVAERSNKNPNLPTGDIEIITESLKVLNRSKVPPFTIETETDGGEELRMEYRYLDLRREVVRKNLQLRHRMATETRKYLDQQGFLEVETPVLIKSTPEGARDFVVPSRLNPGQFYALPQSPQTFKQLLMVSGFDKYFQIVRCFRDEDLRADRQPEFTQIDCEMSFVEQSDVLRTFEGLTRHLFKAVKDIELDEFPWMTYDEAMEKYGTDKPDLRFGMPIVNLNDVAQGKGFQVFDSVELVGGICAKGCAEYSRKQLDELTDWVKRPQIGAKGLVYVKYNEDGTFKSSVDKFFDADALKRWTEQVDAQPGDLILVLAGNDKATRRQLGELRLEMSKRIYKKSELVNRQEEFGRLSYSLRIDSRVTSDIKGITRLCKKVKDQKIIISELKGQNCRILPLRNDEISSDDLRKIEKITKYNRAGNERKRDHLFLFFLDGDDLFKTSDRVRNEIESTYNPRGEGNYKPLWVVDFPLLEWDEATQRYYAMHHPFTSPKTEDVAKLDSDPGSVRANAYDLVINGVEIGGGSIRIHDRGLQQKMFEVLGFTPEKAEAQFGFLMSAFEYGAPPHGGIAFGFDRLCAIFGGQESIRDFIAFPKNNHGRDVMLDAPDEIDPEQLDELHLRLK